MSIVFISMTIHRTLVLISVVLSFKLVQAVIPSKLFLSLTKIPILYYFLTTIILNKSSMIKAYPLRRDLTRNILYTQINYFSCECRVYDNLHDS